MSNVLKVEKLNSVYLKIEAEADIRRELSDYFSFEVPGYKFTPQFRNRVWDGKITIIFLCYRSIICRIISLS